jgi:hypothetical protein
MKELFNRKWEHDQKTFAAKYDKDYTLKFPGKISQI